jgi:hypothetical protein
MSSFDLAQLSELPSRPPGQRRKEISTQRAALLAAFFQEHTGSLEEAKNTPTKSPERSSAFFRP